MATRVAVFGGSFNPIHLAHREVARHVLATEPVDELWFMPTYKHPFDKVLAPYDDRVAMCELVAAEVPRTFVSRAEETLAHAPGFVASRTLDLMTHLAAPDRELRLVVGADIRNETHKWYRWDELVALAPPIWIERAGYSASAAIADISSTRVRALLAAGDPAVAALLPDAVLRYIAEHHLYGSS